MARGKLQPIPPAEAAKAIADEFERMMLIPLGEVLKRHSLTLDQLRPFFASGELVAYVKERRPGAIKPGLKAEDWEAFIARHPELGT